VIVRVLTIVTRDIAFTPSFDNSSGYLLAELHAGQRHGAAVVVASGDTTNHISLAYC
jgi:hypothetical protein